MVGESSVLSLILGAMIYIDIVKKLVGIFS